MIALVCRGQAVLADLPAPASQQHLRALVTRLRQLTEIRTAQG